jgi:DNA-binding transcriptional ArsR family regulator
VSSRPLQGQAVGAGASRQRATVDREDGVALDGPAADRLFDVLENPHARSILAVMGSEPVTAGELSRLCGLASSTLYRQLGELLEAGLVEKTVRLDRGGHHASQYSRTVSDVSISLEDGLVVSLR